jgi:hypothetical protein
MRDIHSYDGLDQDCRQRLKAFCQTGLLTIVKFTTCNRIMQALHVKKMPVNAPFMKIALIRVTFLLCYPGRRGDLWYEVLIKI